MDVINKKRETIDLLDKVIMESLEKRFDLSIEIGIAKASQNKEILDTNREEIILKKISKLSHSPQIEQVYKTIMKESKQLQRK